MSAKPACRKGDVTTGHGPFPSRPSNTGSGNVFINGKPAMRKRDGFPVHCVGSSCHAEVMSSGSETVKINGLDAIRIGDPVDCGEFMALGSNNVFIGN